MRGIFLLLTILCAGCSWTQAPAPVAHYGGYNSPGSSGIHNVNAGDTLYSLSKRYGIDMQDIVHANNLRAPFTLAVGQRIALPPPRTYRVRSGDTLHAVSRMFDVSPSQLARKNNIDAPYIVRTGQILNLPSARDNAVQIAAAAPAPTRTRGQETNTAITREVLAPPTTPKPSDKPAVKTPVKTAAKSTKTVIPKRASSKFLKPTAGKIISGYGPKKNGLYNDGINIAAKRGAPVKAADNGVVVYAGSKLKGSGNLVLLRHSDGWMTAYAHMDSIAVKKGATLTRGQTLGAVGSTGAVSTPQLHFEVRKGTNAVNPVKYLGG